MVTIVRQIVHDPIFLSRKSEQATLNDIEIAQDLMDTLRANQKTCVGMAANMIGACKRVIAFDNDGVYMIMMNPVIIKGSDVFDAEESCLFLLGGPRKTKRFHTIKVRYQNMDFQTRFQTFRGWTAQIIQHEVDHCNGILI